MPRISGGVVKQDAFTAATDDEVEAIRVVLATADANEIANRLAGIAVEQAARIAADALKQDASTAATDPELAGGLASVFATAPTGQIAAGFDVARHYTGTKPVVITLNCGVVSDPGENGHIYFETSPDNVNWTTVQKLSYIACRNRIESIGQIGKGGMIWGIVLPGHWWRYRTYTANGYNTPDFVMDNATEWIYPVVP